MFKSRKGKNFNDSAEGMIPSYWMWEKVCGVFLLQHCIYIVYSSNINEI